MCHTNTFEKGEIEPYKGRPSAELGLPQIKKALDWHNAFSNASRRKVSSFSKEELAEYWRDRWYVVERIYCLLKRLMELWGKIPKSKRSFASITEQKFYVHCKNIRDRALASLRIVKGVHDERGEELPPVQKTSETEDYRKEFKKWLVSRKCVTPKECNFKNKCECPDLLSNHVVLSQVWF